ncbi:MAG: radical SAM protein [Desulfobacterales bacterium]|nr:radical SAM protein [Desulfobacterales bacterium]
MIAEKVKDLGRYLNKFRLFVRIGLKGVTPLRAYVLIRYWFQTVVLKKEIPWLIEFSITYRCQCRCEHCSVSNYFEEAGKKPELTTEQIMDVLSQAVKMGIPKVDLFGGEPLLRKDVLKIIKFGAKKGLYMSLTTNAVALTDELTKKLKKAGIACINISMDSFDKDEHDNGRGIAGLWQKAVDGIGYCRQARIPCLASTFITKDRIINFGSNEDDSHLKKIIDFTKGLKASGLRILFPIISGEWENTTMIEFTEAEKKRVIDNIDTSYAFIEGAFSVRKKQKVCQALSGKILNISPYGDIQLCSAFTDIFGNVKDMPLAELIKVMWSHPTYLENKNRSCCNNDRLRRQEKDR